VSVGISTGRPTRQSTTNNNNNDNLNDNQSANNNPFPNLGQIVNGILSGFLGGGLGAGGPTPPDPNRNSTGTNTGPTLVGGAAVNVDPTLIDLMGRLNNERPQNNDSNTGSEDSQNNGNNASNMTDMFMSFVNGILQIISGGQTEAINVSNFLAQLEGFSYVEGESIANDVFMVMARVLTFQDLFLIFAGNPEPLNRVREPIRQFVSTHILEGKPATNENIQTAVTQIINSWRPGIEVMIVSALRMRFW
jgi:hypothetical protein